MQVALFYGFNGVYVGFGSDFCTPRGSHLFLVFGCLCLEKEMKGMDGNLRRDCLYAGVSLYRRKGDDGGWSFPKSR